MIARTSAVSSNKLSFFAFTATPIEQCVADALHISRVNYTRYETNAVNPDFDTLIALADFFDVTLDSLFNRD